MFSSKASSASGSGLGFYGFRGLGFLGFKGVRSLWYLGVELLSQDSVLGVPARPSDAEI